MTEHDTLLAALPDQTLPRVAPAEHDVLLDPPGNHFRCRLTAATTAAISPRDGTTRRRGGMML